MNKQRELTASDWRHIQSYLRCGCYLSQEMVSSKTGLGQPWPDADLQWRGPECVYFGQAVILLSRISFRGRAKLSPITRGHSKPQHHLNLTSNVGLPEKRQRRLLITITACMTNLNTVWTLPATYVSPTSTPVTDHQYCVHDKPQHRLNATSNVRLWEKRQHRLLITNSVCMTNLSNVWTLPATYLFLKNVIAGYWYQYCVHDKPQQRLNTTSNVPLPQKRQRRLLVTSTVCMTNLSNVWTLPATYVSPKNVNAGYWSTILLYAWQTWTPSERCVKDVNAGYWSPILCAWQTSTPSERNKQRTSLWKTSTPVTDQQYCVHDKPQQRTSTWK